MSIIKELHESAVKRNAVDMAVGSIIGASFGKIFTSLVNNVLMLSIGLLLGGVDCKNLKIILKASAIDAPADTLTYGHFINSLFNFLIVAFLFSWFLKGLIL